MASAPAGSRPAVEAIETAVEARTEIVDRIVAAKATTLAGLHVRAVVVRDIYDGDLSGDHDDETADRRLMWATLRNIAALPAV